MSHPCPRCGCKTNQAECHRHFFQKSPVTDRFWSKVQKGAPGDCWLWQGAHDRLGYGRFFVGPERFIAPHRFAWEETNGTIAPGLQIDHLCRTPSCVNPAHLEPVTPRENLLRGTGFAAKHAQQTHCKHGHPFSGENTYISARGSRVCRTCGRLTARGRKVSLMCVDRLDRNQPIGQEALAL